MRCVYVDLVRCEGCGLTGELKCPVKRSHSLHILTVHVPIPFQNESETLLHVEAVQMGLITVVCRPQHHTQ